MTMPKNPYQNSPYDASGMPLGTTTADYDNLEDVAKHTVKDKPVEFPKSINDIDYQPRQLTKKETGLDERYLPKKNFNSAISDPEVPNMEVVDAVDFDDPEEKRKLAIKDAFTRDIGVMKLPETEKPEVVKEVAEEVKQDEIAKNEDPVTHSDEVDDDFLKTLDERVDTAESEIKESEEK